MREMGARCEESYPGAFSSMKPGALLAAPKAAICSLFKEKLAVSLSRLGACLPEGP